MVTSEVPREHQPAGRVRLLMITADVDGPGQVHSDSSVAYTYTADGTPY